MSETPWADSPIHKQIRDAGLDNGSSLAASTCSLCGGMGELEGFAGVGRMPCHRCEQFAAEGGTDGRILESRRPLPSVATSHQKENSTGQERDSV